MGVRNEKRPGGGNTEDVYVSILRAGERLERRVALLLKGADLSPPQYNVLRILRGAEPEGLTCGKIRERMINRVPDVTRLLDRLESAALVERRRDDRDRRIVTQRITPKGLEKLAALDGPVRDLHRTQLGHLGVDELGELHRLLNRILTESPEEQSPHPADS